MNLLRGVRGSVLKGSQPVSQQYQQLSNHQKPDCMNSNNKPVGDDREEVVRDLQLSINFVREILSLNVSVERN